MPGLLDQLLAFGRVLRAAGLDVHVGRMLDVTVALQHIGLGVREDVYYACRALLVHRHDDLAVFDRAFEAFWAARTSDATPSGPGQGDGARDGPPEDGPPAAAAGTGLAPVETASSDDDATSMPVWSDIESLATKDFADFAPHEIAAARAALEALSWRPGLRRTRRWVRGGGPRLDLRRAFARSVRTAGDVVVLPRRRRRERPRSLVLLCDVSGSMERYSRMLLHFAYALASRDRRVEAFLFSTQLTRVTRQLRARGVGDAASAISRTVPDWSGGTRIGAALSEFHRRWSRRVLTRGPVVLLVSDGWDRGDPGVLRDQVARLQRGCHRLIWLNPLIGTEGYEPLTRGLQAALPFVDDFLPVRTLRSLSDLAVHLNGLGGGEGRIDWHPRWR